MVGDDSDDEDGANADDSLVRAEDLVAKEAEAAEAEAIEDEEWSGEGLRKYLEGIAAAPQTPNALRTILEVAGPYVDRMKELYYYNGDLEDEVKKCKTKLRRSERKVAAKSKEIEELNDKYEQNDKDWEVWVGNLTSNADAITIASLRKQIRTDKEEFLKHEKMLKEQLERDQQLSADKMQECEKLLRKEYVDRLKKQTEQAQLLHQHYQHQADQMHQQHQQQAQQIQQQQQQQIDALRRQLADANAAANAAQVRASAAISTTSTTEATRNAAVATRDAALARADAADSARGRAEAAREDALARADAADSARAVAETACDAAVFHANAVKAEAARSVTRASEVQALQEEVRSLLEWKALASAAGLGLEREVASLVARNAEMHRAGHLLELQVASLRTDVSGRGNSLLRQDEEVRVMKERLEQTGAALLAARQELDELRQQKTKAVASVSAFVAPAPSAPPAPAPAPSTPPAAVSSTTETDTGNARPARLFRLSANRRRRMDREEGSVFLTRVVKRPLSGPGGSSHVGRKRSAAAASGTALQQSVARALSMPGAWPEDVDI